MGCGKMPDRRYIEQEKRFRRKIDELAPTIYAAFCIALHRHYGFGYERILRVLKETQVLWHDAAVGYNDIVKICEEETGIDLMSHLTAKEHGVEGDATI